MNATLRIIATFLVLMTTVQFGNAHNVTMANSVEPIVVLLPTGSIHIEGDILIVDAPSSSILKTTIFETVNQTKVVAFNGCFASKCEYDITQLPAGTYYVRVTTDSGVFGDFVQRD